MSRGFVRYDLLEKTSGGAGAGPEVWTAVAFHVEGESTDVVLERFVGEAQPEAFLEPLRAASALDHENIVRIHECGFFDDDCFLSRERTTGMSARDLLEASALRGPVPPRVALGIVSGVLRALHHAHRKGIAHGQVAPEHVRLSVGGQTKLTGFGLRSGGSAPDDLLAAGLLLHELLTGQPVFPAATPPSGTIPPPSRVGAHVPAELDALVMSLCEPLVEKRHATGLDAVEAIAAWGRDRNVVLHDDGLAELVASMMTPAPAIPVSTRWRIVAGESRGPFPRMVTDQAFQRRLLQVQREKERVTRKSTDPYSAAARDVAVDAGEENTETRPAFETVVYDVTPDPGEVTREGTREMFAVDPAPAAAPVRPPQPAPPRAPEPPASVPARLRAAVAAFLRTLRGS